MGLILPFPVVHGPQRGVGEVGDGGKEEGVQQVQSVQRPPDKRKDSRPPGGEHIPKFEAEGIDFAHFIISFSWTNRNPGI